MPETKVKRERLSDTERAARGLEVRAQKVASRATLASLIAETLREVAAEMPENTAKSVLRALATEANKMDTAAEKRQATAQALTVAVPRIRALG